MKNDGRNIDPSSGRLSGEAAGQQPRSNGARSTFEAWDRVPSEGSSGSGSTYFDLPVVKEPVWIWSVPAYFYVGGAAGTAAFLGGVLQAVDGDRYGDLIGRCRRIGAAGTAVGTAFLIHDLGRPSRFLNMMRVFRPTSAMSMGSWTLAATASATAASALGSQRDGVVGRFGELSGAAASMLGLPLAGYTAVLLSDTAVPLWQSARRSLPWLFICAGLSASTDALVLSGLSPKDETLVERIGVVAKVGELAATVAVSREAEAVERVGRPLKEGVGGSLWRAAASLTVASLGLSLFSGRSQATKKLGAVIGAVGGLALRFALFHAGKASARDPRATFEQQRAGSAATEATAR